MIETLQNIDSRVVQITEEHVRDADRLLAQVWEELPDGKARNFSAEGLIGIENGGISHWYGDMFHASFMFPHALVGQDLYLLKTVVPTVEKALEVIAKFSDQEKLGWGVNIDASKTLDDSMAEAGVNYGLIGLWRKEEQLPDEVKAKLGVING